MKADQQFDSDIKHRDLTVSLKRGKYIPQSTHTSKFRKHKVSLANVIHYRSCSFLSFQLSQKTCRKARLGWREDASEE